MIKKLILPIACFSFYACATGTIFLSIIKNKSDATFKYFGDDEEQGAFLLTPHSTKNSLENFTGINNKKTFALTCVKGGLPSVYMKKGIGEASRVCTAPTNISEYIEDWQDNPSAFDDQKRYTPFCAEGDAFIGLVIEPDGSTKIIPIQGVELFGHNEESEALA